MITGDHRDTAVAIARRLGIWQKGDQVLSGGELKALSQLELEKRVEKLRFMLVFLLKINYVLLLL